MKKLISALILLGGFATPAYAHTLSWQEGATALYHQLLGMHHLPSTALLIVVGLALFIGWRKRTG